MSTDPTYLAAARRADTLRQLLPSPVSDYYDGYRRGLGESRSPAVANVPEHDALRAAGRVTPREIRSGAYQGDLARVARAWGVEDGLRWQEPGVRPGLARLAIVQSGLSAREWAETVARDERSVRNWQTGHVIPAAALRAIERQLWGDVGVDD